MPQLCTHLARTCRSARIGRRLLHWVAHHTPLFDRLCVAAGIILMLTACGVELDRLHILDVFAYAICESIAHFVNRL